MRKPVCRCGLWGGLWGGLPLTLCFVMAMLVTAAPALAEMIRFGHSGSIHGGAMWEIRPDDSVIFTAYQADAAVAQHPDWVWDNRSTLSGHISFALPGAYASASAIVRKRFVRLGPAPAHPPICTDAGQFIVEVDIPDLTYSAMVDACIINTPDIAPFRVLRHYRALKAATDEIHDALRLDRLF